MPHQKSPSQEGDLVVFRGWPASADCRGFDVFINEGHILFEIV